MSGLAVAGLLLQLISVVCFLYVLIHAFERSVGTGFMVLCIPVYNLYYGFSQFEHRKKGLIIAGWIGCFVAGVVLRVLAFKFAASEAPALKP
jgi:translocator protein